MRNGRDTYSSSGPFEIDGDVVIVYDPNACCPRVPYGFHWSIDGDALTLSREPGFVASTSYVLKPWTKVADAAAPTGETGGGVD